VQLLEVELKLLALKKISVGTTRLARARRHGSEDATSLELVLEGLVESVVGIAGSNLTHDVLGLLYLFLGLVVLLAEQLTVVLLVPGLEGSGINLHDGVLCDGLGTDKLIVGSVVHNIEDPGLPGHSLGTPRVVTRIKTESSVLDVATTAPYESYTLADTTRNKLKKEKQQNAEVSTSIWPNYGALQIELVQ